MTDADPHDLGPANRMVVFANDPVRRLRAALWLKARSPIMIFYATILLACVLLLAGRLRMEGRIVRKGEDGFKEIRIPVSGPRRRGTLYVEATRTAREWSLDRLEFEPEDSDERIDLLESAEPD